MHYNNKDMLGFYYVLYFIIQKNHWYLFINNTTMLTILAY